MGKKIIDFRNNPVVNLKRELSEKDKELEIIKRELAFFKHIYSTTASIGDLLKLQVADIGSNVNLLQSHLGLVQDNLNSIKNKIDSLDSMKDRVKSTPPTD